MQAPKSYTEAGLFTIIAGALNVLTAFGWFLGLVWFCVGLLWLVPMAIGAYQIYVGVAMQGGKPNSGAKQMGVLGLVAGIFNMNVITIVLGVLTMTKLKEPEVAGYLETSA